MGICFFIGHRDAPESIYPDILSAVQDCINAEKEIEFIIGRYGRFDAMAARAVQESKHSNPSIKLTLLTPFLTSKPLPQGFDGAVYPPDMEYVPKRIAIVKANQYAARLCDMLIAYAVHPASNASNLLEYVQPRIRRNEIRLIRLYKSE